MISDKIIGFAGRLQSGKTELANICTEFGYEKLSVATPLKTMIAACLLETVEGVNMLKTAKLNYVFDKDDQEYISYCTRVPFEIVHDKLEGKVFENTREMMQFIGTEIIREYNPNWHVDELKKLIKDDVKYVIDDIRFPNELALIQELGGVCWCVVRPKINNVINHDSEISLPWNMFEHVIVNDGSLVELQNKWRNFITMGYAEAVERRRELLLEGPTNNKELIEEFSKHLISGYWITYSPFLRNRNDIEYVIPFHEHVIVGFTYGTTMTIDNPLLIEDLKMYL